MIFSNRRFSGHFSCEAKKSLKLQDFPAFHVHPCTTIGKTEYENGVQEAASSNLVTRTNAEYRFSILCVFFVLLPQRTSGLLGAKRRSIRCRPVRTIRPATVRSTRSTLLSSEYALRHTATTANMIPICSIQMENILTERKDPTVNTIRRRII